LNLQSVHISDKVATVFLIYLLIIKIKIKT